MEQKTAVEWLFMTLALTPMTDWYNVLEQAKAMEKEQIIDAFNDGDFMSCGSEKDAINYYNEKYDRAADTE
jgi:hypothetical protein